MKRTQFISFELTPECNFAKLHLGKCPSGDADRFGSQDTSKRLNDDTVIECVKYAYEQGFQGLVTWHAYNEPLTAWQRTRDLMLRLKQEVPQVRFGLWTNGSYIGVRVQPEELSIFSAIWISNYLKRDWSYLKEFCPILTVLDGELDGRKGPGSVSTCRCVRPFNELVINAYGNAQLCCADWKCETGLGNVHVEGYAEIVRRFKLLRDKVSQHPMPDDVPTMCTRCTIRSYHLDCLVPEPYVAAQQYLAGLRDEHTD